jgi:hypothetical protein
LATPCGGRPPLFKRWGWPKPSLVLPPSQAKKNIVLKWVWPAVWGGFGHPYGPWGWIMHPQPVNYFFFFFSSWGWPTHLQGTRGGFGHPQCSNKDGGWSPQKNLQIFLNFLLVFFKNKNNFFNKLF